MYKGKEREGSCQETKCKQEKLSSPQTEVHIALSAQGERREPERLQKSKVYEEKKQSVSSPEPK